MYDLILATNNNGKLQELENLLTPLKCISQASLGLASVEETGKTFIENALIKARHAASFSNKPAIADDSGLVVPALNGEPGIYSARYASENANDEENISYLLTKLKNYSASEREAYFYCVLVFMKTADDPTPLIASGKIHGFISTEAKGQNGFGYDPVFFLKDYNCTMAELSAKIKSTISHRAQALKMLKQLWQQYL